MSGFGFQEPPLLSFFDSCDNGSGCWRLSSYGNSVSPLTDGTNVAAGAVGGLPVTSNGLPVNAGGVGGIPVTTPNGQQVVQRMEIQSPLVEKVEHLLLVVELVDHP